MRRTHVRLALLASLVGSLLWSGCSTPAQPLTGTPAADEPDLHDLLYHPAWQDSLGSEVAAVYLLAPDQPVPRLVIRQQFAELAKVPPEVARFYHLRVDSARHLEQLLDRIEGAPGQVAAASVVALPQDLAYLPAAKRKELFIRALLPLVLFHNQSIEACRRRLEGLAATPPEQLQPGDRTFLSQLGEQYRLDQADRRLGDLADTLQVLLDRVDQVPPALVLAQGALESGWGSSRFCWQRNSLFGEHAWSTGTAGLAPGRRRQVPRYRLTSFPVIGASIASYMQNLNTNPAYAEFRALRSRMRRQGRLLEPMALAMGLDHYSSRGDDYIGDVLQLINQNQLTRFNGLALTDGLSLLNLDG